MGTRSLKSGAGLLVGLLIIGGLLERLGDQQLGQPIGQAGDLLLQDRQFGGIADQPTSATRVFDPLLDLPDLGLNLSQSIAGGLKCAGRDRRRRGG